MTTHEDVQAFKDHRLWGVAASVIALAEGYAGKSTTDRNELARVLAVSRYAKSYRPIEAYLFLGARVQQADQVAAQFDGLESQLTGWNRDAAMIPTTVAALDAHCDAILTHIHDYRWPTARKGREADAFADAADAYRKTADKSLEGIADAIGEAKARLAELEGMAKALAEESVLRSVDAAASVKSIADTQLAQSENAQESLRQELKKVREAAQEQRTGLDEEAGTLLAGLQKNHEMGNDLVKKVADQEIGGGYLEFAEKEQAAHGKWNIMGIGAAVAAFAYLAIVFSPNSISTDAAVLKVGISLSVIGLSAYAFREAGKRQRQSVEARYRALDVLALPPFSKGLGEAQSQQLRYLMGERLFGSSIESTTGRGRSEGKSTSLNLSVDPASIKVLADAATSLRAAPATP